MAGAAWSVKERVSCTIYGVILLTKKTIMGIRIHSRRSNAVFRMSAVMRIRQRSAKRLRRNAKATLCDAALHKPAHHLLIKYHQAPAKTAPSRSLEVTE